MASILETFKENQAIPLRQMNFWPKLANIINLAVCWMYDLCDIKQTVKCVQSTWALSHKSPEPVKEYLVNTGISEKQHEHLCDDSS